MMQLVNQPQERSATPVEDVEVRGHVIDSLILPKILDCISANGGAFRIKDIAIGQARSDPTYALIEVRAETAAALAGSWPRSPSTGRCRPWPAIAGSRRPTWRAPFPRISTARPISGPRCGWTAAGSPSRSRGWTAASPSRRPRRRPLRADGRRSPRRRDRRRPRRHPRLSRGAVPRAGDVRVHGEQRLDREAQGGRHPADRSATGRQPRRWREDRRGGRAGGRPHRQRRIPPQADPPGLRRRLLAGNALAAHDIEQAMFGTSLGVYLDRGQLAQSGNEHHLRAINRIRRVGGIRQAVEAGLLTSGIMYECVRRGTEFLLAGSIRDDGPLPEVVTDAVEAKHRMRELLRGATFCLMIATTLHSVAVANLLPAWVKVVCVDINPSTAIKLSDRGSFQTVGLVTDVAPFLRALVEEISAMEEGLRSLVLGLGASVFGPKPKAPRPKTEDQDQRPPRHDFPRSHLDVPARVLRDRLRDQSLDGPQAAGRPRSGDPPVERFPPLAGRSRGDGLLVPPVAGLPDLVFTANAALVVRDTAILAHFRPIERRPRSRCTKRGSRPTASRCGGWGRTCISRGRATPSFAATHCWPATASAATSPATTRSPACWAAA